jgi:hypothetical protein
VLASILAQPAPDLPLTWQLVGVVISVASATAVIMIYLNRVVSDLKRTFYRVVSTHNREDDDRFELQNQNVWDIHLHLAAPEKTPLRPPRTLPRRRYLVEEPKAGDGNGD